MNNIQTRVATISDLEVISSLFDAYRQFYEQPSDIVLATRFIRERILSNESAIILASNDDNEVVGFCQLYPIFCSIEAKPIYSLSDLYVIPGARRSGAGRALLHAAERLSATREKAKMELTTARTNKTAQAAYEACGWVKDEVFIAYSKRIEA
jgi:ribosomal protein S18 acetylase RimI-like enzyme